jgi:hypothetical protein
MPDAVGKKLAPPDSLEKPEDYKRVDVCCKATHERTGGEKREGDEENPFPTKGVAQVSRQRHSRGDADVVDGDGPPSPEDGGAQVLYQVRESNGYNCCVDGVHQKTQRSSNKDEVAAHELESIHDCVDKGQMGKQSLLRSVNLTKVTVSPCRQYFR